MSELTRSGGDGSLDDPSFDDRAVEAVLAGSGNPGDPVAAAVLDLRRTAARMPAPQPSAELAALFAGGVPVDELARRRNKSFIVLGVVVAAGSTLALSGVAAAHDALPGPAQSIVTGIVNDLTPFHIATIGRSSTTPKAPGPADTSTSHRSVSASPSEHSGRSDGKGSGGEDRPRAGSSSAAGPGDFGGSGRSGSDGTDRDGRGGSGPSSADPSGDAGGAGAGEESDGSGSGRGSSSSDAPDPGDTDSSGGDGSGHGGGGHDGGSGTDGVPVR
jgi:hypothetical protein